ncbi:MAG: DUF421 domain-containing protein [Bacteroidota bacterium]
MNEYVEIILRSIAVYLFIVIAIRLFGKTELAQLSVTDLVFILLISNSVQNAMVGPSTSLNGGLTAALSLFLLNYMLKRITFKSKALTTFLQGEPVMLVHNGKIIKKHLEKVMLTEDELMAAVREHGVDSIEKVNLAILEADGNISILSSNYHHQTRKKRPHKIIHKQ